MPVGLCTVLFRASRSARRNFVLADLQRFSFSPGVRDPLLALFGFDSEITTP